MKSIDRSIGRQMNQPGSLRVWKTSDSNEARSLSEFLSVCTSKLTSSEMSDLKQDDLKSVFDAYREGKISLEKIKSLDTNELYDLIIGQLRLF